MNGGQPIAGGDPVSLSLGTNDPRGGGGERWGGVWVGGGEGVYWVACQSCQDRPCLRHLLYTQSAPHLKMTKNGHTLDHQV